MKFNLTLLACLVAVGASAGPPSPPNIIFFLIDDLGWKDLGCYGSTFHETPHIDQLAKEGVRFTDAYAASPVCSPTRASILTGKYPCRVGITRATPQVSLASEEVTIAEALKEAGYRTAHMGKWHLQVKKEKGKAHYPEAQGFDLNVAGHTSGGPASYFYPTILEMAGVDLKPKQHLDGVNLAPLLKGETETLGREAIYFHFPHDHHLNTMGASGAVRVGDYKLVERFANMKVELFNLGDDIGEQNDLSEDMPKLTSKLTKMLHDWRKESGAVMPVPTRATAKKRIIKGR